jgi:hypothetical protein
MNRRKFLLLSFVGAAATTVPWYSCRNHGNIFEKTLAKPQLLSHFCDEKTVSEIGKAYRKQVPAETGKEDLVNMLLTEKAGKLLPESSNTSVIHSLLTKKIHNDYEAGRTVVLKGWVLSVTEGRQCALFSLI